VKRCQKGVRTDTFLWEAAEQIRLVEREPAAATRIGQAARRRVLGTHTWQTRLRQIAARL